MDPSVITKEFKDRVCEQVSLRPEGDGRFAVITPFRFEDGDHFGIFLKRDKLDWVITDEGNTLLHLSYELEEQDMESGNRGQIIDSALSGFSVQNRSGELVIPVSEGHFGDALFNFVQALTKVTDVSFLSRERVRSTFIEDFRDFLRSKISPERLQFDWTDEEHDPSGNYPVDARINHMERPLLVYALPSEEKVSIATISLLTFERWRMPFESMGVFEEQETLNRKTVARFTDVCGKMFSNLEGNKDRISVYLDQITTKR
jgi:hypothetical protein